MKFIIKWLLLLSCGMNYLVHSGITKCQIVYLVQVFLGGTVRPPKKKTKKSPNPSVGNTTMVSIDLSLL